MEDRTESSQDAKADTEKVYVVVADYGLNGAGVLGIYRTPPSEEILAELPRIHFPNSPYGPVNVTGYSGIAVEEHVIAETVAANA